MKLVFKPFAIFSIHIGYVNDHGPRHQQASAGRGSTENEDKNNNTDEN